MPESTPSAFYITEVNKPGRQPGGGYEYVVTRQLAGAKNATHVKQVKDFLDALKLVILREGNAGDIYYVRKISGKRLAGKVGGEYMREITESTTTY